MTRYSIRLPGGIDVKILDFGEDYSERRYGDVKCHVRDGLHEFDFACFATPLEAAMWIAERVSVEIDVACSWCGSAIRWRRRGEPALISHGMCKACVAGFEADI